MTEGSEPRRNPPAATPRSTGDGTGERLAADVEDEERLLADAPSVDRDGAEVRREVDEGPTAATMLTASEIAETQEYGPLLDNLRGAVEGEKGERRR